MEPMTNWSLLPPEDIDDEDPERDAEDDESPDDAEESEEDDGDEDEDSEDESEDEGPVSRKQYVTDTAAQREMVADLRRSVGRAQSMAEQYRQGSDEVREELRAQNETVADLLALIVESIDDSVIDPTLKAKIKAARDDIAEAARDERTEKRVRESLGIDPEAVRLSQERARLQATVDELSADLEEEITSVGLDPDEFDWDGVKRAFLDGGVPAGKRFAREKIRAAVQEQMAGARRSTRKAAAGKTPKPGAADPPTNKLATGSFKDQKAALDELLK